MDNKMDQIGEKELQSLPREAQSGAKQQRNRRFSLALLSLFLIAALFGLYHLPSSATTGTGTAADPFQIATSQDLAKFRDAVNSGDVNLNAKLIADIDLEGTADNQWTPIGSESVPFKGIFDGQGHTISGLYISSDQTYQGLFAKIESESSGSLIAEVKNLAVSGYVTGHINVGLIVGMNTNGKITNCKANGTITGIRNESASENVGGIVGQNYSEGQYKEAIVSNCTANVNVESKSIGTKAGGIAGLNRAEYERGGGKATIINCVAIGSMSSSTQVGGIVGANEARESETTAVVQNCMSQASVNGINGIVGGIVGYNIALTYKTTTVVSNCTANGTIKGGSVIGGIVGDLASSYYTSKATIENCAVNVTSIVNTDTGDYVYVGNMVGRIYTHLITYGDENVKIKNCGWLAGPSVPSIIVGGSQGYGTITKQDVISYNASAPIVVTCIPEPINMKLVIGSTDTVTLKTYPSTSATLFGTYITSVGTTLVPNSPEIASITSSGNRITVAAGTSPGTAAINTNFTITPTWFNGNCDATSAAYSKNMSTTTNLYVKKDATRLTIENISAQPYTGNAITPALTVKDGRTELVLNTDYTVAYSNNTDAGEATATITGINNYTGTKAKTFTITPKAIVFNIAEIPNQPYTGSAITPALTVKDGTTELVLDKDYTVKCTSNINVGTATAKITGKGNYTGTKTVKFTITAKQVTITPTPGQYKVEGTMDPIFTYTASEITNPAITGVLSRVAGESVGFYKYSLGTLTAGSNYTLTLGGSATFEIKKGGSPDPDPKPVPVKPKTYDNIDDAAKAANIEAANLQKDPETDEVTVKDEIAQDAIKSAGATGTSSKILPIATASTDASSDIAGLMFEVKGYGLGVANIQDVKAVKILSDGRGEMFNVATKKEDIADKTAAVYEDASADIFASGDIDYTKDYYLVVYILDGGSFDLDGKKDGTVTDPVALVKTSQQQHSSGGCNAGLGALAILALIPVVLRRKRK